MELTKRIADIKLLVLDVDGVLTDGKLYFTAQGQTTKAFHVRDGHGIRLLLHHNIEVAVISARQSEAVGQRMQDLGVQHVYLGFKDKTKALEDLLSVCQLRHQQTAYFGDDLPDLSVMKKVHLACAPADAHTEIQKIAHWVSSANGGQGAVRELSELILKEQGCWEDVMNYCQ